MTKMEDQELGALLEAYEENGIVLVLGAGVSHNSNIPDWPGLLSRLMTEREKSTTDHAFNQLVENGLPMTVIASYLEEKFKTRHNFVEGVRNALYDEFPFKGREVDKYARGEFMRYIRKGIVGNEFRKPGVEYKPNPTLRSIGALCTVKRWEKNKKGKLVLRNFCNPRVRAIVTLNMDALLETYVYAFSTKHLLRTVERPSAETFGKTINLYHMHGYLHFNPNAKPRKRDSTEAVVMTELDYYDFFNRPNGMFNYTFLYLLREYPCLFIGLSMQDENIRRLLHYSKLERMDALAKKEGITLKKLGQDEALMEKEIRRHYVILSRNENSLVNKVNEDTLGALGVKILWLKSYSEIPVLLEKLYTSLPEDRAHWAKVYGRG